jgi:hypothetical protein
VVVSDCWHDRDLERGLKLRKIDATAFQAMMRDEPYIDAGLDKFLFMLPKRYLNEAALWRQVVEPTRPGRSA